MIFDLRARKDEDEIQAVPPRLLPASSRTIAWVGGAATSIAERELNLRVEAFLRDRGASASHPLVLFGENAANPHADPAGGCFVPVTWSARTSRRPSTATGATDTVRHRGPADRVGARDVGARPRRAGGRRSPPARPERRRATSRLRSARVLETGPTSASSCTAPGMRSGSLSTSRPSSSQLCDAACPGMIFTVEPGLYQAALGGIRLEDDVVVRGDSPEILSTLPLELVELNV